MKPTSPWMLYFWPSWEMSPGSNWRYEFSPLLGKGDPDSRRLGGLEVKILRILGKEWGSGRSVRSLQDWGLAGGGGH